MKQKQRGIHVRVSPARVRMTLPIHHVHDLPQVARRLRQLADNLTIIHQANHLRENQRLWEAYQVIRAMDRRINKENPDDPASDH